VSDYMEIIDLEESYRTVQCQSCGIVAKQ